MAVLKAQPYQNTDLNYEIWFFFLAVLHVEMYQVFLVSPYVLHISYQMLENNVLSAYFYPLVSFLAGAKNVRFLRFCIVFNDFPWFSHKKHENLENSEVPN